MQMVFEMTYIWSILAMAISAIVAVYLFILWYRQENRLLTDLPLLFSITFFAMTFNMLLQILPTMNIMPMTMELFRLRTLVICGSAFPLIAALLHIWLPRYEQYHRKFMIVLAAYWVAVALFGPTQAAIMTLLIPVLLIPILGMTATFAITWKTDRLKEVRSDLMAVALILVLISQLTKIPLLSTSLAFIPDLLTSFGSIIAAVGLANPWFHLHDSAVAIGRDHSLQK